MEKMYTNPFAWSPGPKKTLGERLLQAAKEAREELVKDGGYEKTRHTRSTQPADKSGKV